MALTRQVYRLTENLPKREAYGLTDQMRRAAVSVASNIAEGYGRLSDLQFRQFLGNARGSLCELQTQVELATDLDYLKKEDGRELMVEAAEVGRILNGLIVSLKPSPIAKASGTSSANTANPASPASPADYVS
jgi:four helix bundle protein